MLALSVAAAVLAASMFLVALYELAGFWWALLACSFFFALVAVLAGYLADQPAPVPEREAH